MRQIITRAAFPDRLDEKPWSRGEWPAQWVTHPDAPPPPHVNAYRLDFEVSENSVARIHVSADERYELFLDGNRLGRGPERGDPEHWRFETYDLKLAPGPHTLAARVYAWGALAPLAQLSVRPGFLLAAEGVWTTRLSTGAAPWRVRRLDHYHEEPSTHAAVGPTQVLRGIGSGGDFSDHPQPWVDAKPGPRARTSVAGWGDPHFHQLTPATLPPMLSAPVQGIRLRHLDQPPEIVTNAIPVKALNHLAREAESWNAMLAGRSALTVPPRSIRRVVLDLGDYYCAYQSIQLTGGGGATLRVTWAEALYENLKGQTKGNRSDIEGKFVRGPHDRIEPDGGGARVYETLWWRSGRYVELAIQTADQPLTLERLAFEETRCPLHTQSHFTSDDARWPGVEKVLFRGLAMCSHETYMDCPHYEQLMYVGDTRLEVLTTYALTTDDRLPLKAVETFAASRRHDGLTDSRYPSRRRQVIPPFSLWWIGMLNDLALWRGRRAEVARLQPVARGVLEYFLSLQNADGLVAAPNGWNFIDWVQGHGWNTGIPPHGQDGFSAAINLQFLLALQDARQLETWLDEPALADRWRIAAEKVGRGILKCFWNEQAGLLADTLEHTHYSQHAQVLAVLAGLFDPHRANTLMDRMKSTPGLAPTSIYFSHYTLDALARLGRMDDFFDRLKLWYDLPGMGFMTTLESPEPSRSDCHGWGAHPIYHMYASVLGVRPASFGFTSVTLRPQLGPLTHIHASMIHPAGSIEAQVNRRGPTCHGRITLPPTITGQLLLPDRQLPLQPGPNVF